MIPKLYIHICQKINTYIEYNSYMLYFPQYISIKLVYYDSDLNKNKILLKSKLLITFFKYYYYWLDNFKFYKDNGNIANYS